MIEKEKRRSGEGIRVKMKERLKRLTGSFIAGMLLLFVAEGACTNAFAAVEYEQDIREPEELDVDDKVVILHSNDVHGAIDFYPAMTGLKKDFESRGAEVIMVDAGDFSQGHPYVNTTKGMDAVTMMNSAGYDYATLGNHEFDFGLEQMQSNLKEAKFKVLCANASKDGKVLYAQNDVYTAANGVRIGFFGLDTPESRTKANPKLVQGVDFLSGKELYACAGKQVEELNNKGGADTVIMLSHLGVGTEAERGGNRSVDVYNNTDGIDFVIDGHSHTVMTEGASGEPVQSTGTKFQYIGVVILDDNGEIEDHCLVSTENLTKDAGAEKDAKEIEDRIDSELSGKIADSGLMLKGGKEVGRTEETALGDLITDAMYWFTLKNEKEALKVPGENVVAIENGGGIRDNLPEGEVTRKDLLSIQPFGNSLAIVYVTGSELLEILEASTFCTPDPVGGYPQTCGIKWSLDTGKEFKQGDAYPDSTYYKPASINRVTIESIGGKAFDESETYAVVTNDFCAEGGDTYYVLGSKEGFFTGILLEDIMGDYIDQELGGVIRKEKYSSIRGDLTVTGSAGKEEAEPSDSDVYKVVAGDCLWKIAGNKYGDGTRWKEIYELNTSIIDDPSLIFIGQELKLPAA